MVMPSQFYGKVTVQYLIVIKIFFYHLTFVSKAQDKITVPVMAVDVHYMPEYGLTAYLYHGFGTVLSLFLKACTQTAAENYNLHVCSLFLIFYLNLLFLKPIRKVKTTDSKRFLNTSLCSLCLRGKYYQKPQRRRGTESFFKILFCVSVVHSQICY